MKFEIDKNSVIPIYRQIIQQMTTHINQGALKAGDKLPAERDLAAELNISRGTITKAYGELERNDVIEVIRGSGSFVAKEQDVLDKGRKEQAITLIDHTIKELEKMQFSFHEMKLFFDLMVMEREKQLEGIPIATVDCNPEALTIFKNQIGYISKVEITRFLLEDLIKLPDIPKVFEPYHLIITTSNHYDELIALLPEQKDKIVKAAVSPSQQTIIDLAKIGHGDRIGILCYTHRFFEIIRETLLSFGIGEQQFANAQVEGLDEHAIEKFLQDKKYLLLPADSNIEHSYRQVIMDFKRGGGKIIYFEYQIQRGTLIYIEERIYHIINRQK
ncbi:GntR family transcriptional regulator [Vallitalea pronyensis]|uniref:GntR family transcriptional regulator n=1 Tax=Vallitalea pronyensis TaxID=1348613 RepID=A0A8J8MJE3_9FIRM|nr:GntR family transcriptional regulator [Vallitalea pronyensis]QUI22596.1 GntR family transcriptional regulator [Vallitalea pronyensis]